MGNEDVIFSALSDQNIHAYLTDYIEFRDNVRKGDHGKTAQLWMSYVHHIWLLLQLMRAVKTNNYVLYTQCLCLMPDLFWRLQLCQISHILFCVHCEH